MKVRNLKIAIMMVTLVRGRMGGTEVFADELIPRISKLLSDKKDGNELTQVLSSDVKPLNVESQVVLINTPMRGTGGVARAVNYVFFRFFYRYKNNDDIAFYPFTAILPLPQRGTKTVMLIHDLQHRVLPKLFSAGQKIYRKLTYELPAKQADIVVTISDFTSLSVKTELGISEKSIKKIYPGIDHGFFSYKERESWENSGQGFIYYPARGLAHKNHHRLFEAIALVREQFPLLRLVLTGADVDSIGPLPDFVTHEGHVSRERVRELYQDADALVFPSLYEGFGFPPLEAMAVGCPVVCSNSGSLPEVCGQGARYFDALNVREMSQAVIKTLETPQEKIILGRSNSQRFDWDSTAAQYMEIFAELSENF